MGKRTPLSVAEARSLKKGDVVQFRSDNGRFYPAVVQAVTGRDIVRVTVSYEATLRYTDTGLERLQRLYR